MQPFAIRFRIHAAPTTVAAVAHILAASGIGSDPFEGTEHVYINVAVAPEHGEPVAHVRRAVTEALGYVPLRVQALLAPGGYWADAVPPVTSKTGEAGRPQGLKAEDSAALTGRAGA